MQLKLDLQFFAGEKTEKATPKKRQDERKKGRVCKKSGCKYSALFTVFLVFYSSCIADLVMKESMLTLYSSSFTEYIFWNVTEQSVMKLLKEALFEFAIIVATYYDYCFYCWYCSKYVQVGFLFTTEPLKFDLKKIDPIKGAKRIFSIRALVELLKSFLKFVVLVQ